MPDVFHTFRRGHKMMVVVQGSWFPLVDRNPQTFVDIYHAREADFQKATQRVVRARNAKRALCRTDECPHGALAAVGERHLLDSRIWPRATDAARDRGRDGDRVSGAFERLGGDDHPRRGVSMHRGIL